MKKLCRVEGRVQGVWFRDSTRTQAKSLNINGYAKNLSDGRVEVVMQGKEADLLKLIEWLSHGPQYAKVDKINCKEYEQDIEAGFYIY